LIVSVEIIQKLGSAVKTFGINTSFWAKTCFASLKV